MELSSLPIVALTLDVPLAPGGFARLEALLALLREKGLRTALLLAGRHDWGPVYEGLCGLRTTGVTICIPAAGGTGADHGVGQVLRLLASCHDVVLAAGEPLPPLPGQCRLDAGTGEGIFHLAAGIFEFLSRQWQAPEVLGCILIGGKSSRMGRPKHLLLKDGRTWLRRTADILAQVCSQVVLVGQGDLGGISLPQLPDVPGVAGPLAGVLAARRWQPWASLLVCACDMPEISVAALNWLLAQRRPGAWAVIPSLDGRHQPLLALYDFRIGPALEDMARQGQWRMSGLIAGHGACTPELPLTLRQAWRNVNSPEQL